MGAGERPDTGSLCHSREPKAMTALGPKKSLGQHAASGSCIPEADVTGTTYTMERTREYRRTSRGAMDPAQHRAFEGDSSGQARQQGKRLSALLQ